MFIRYFIYFYAVSVCLECTHPQGIFVATCKPNWLRLVCYCFSCISLYFIFTSIFQAVFLRLCFKLCLEICKYV